jgi:hypothetical protein
MSDEIPAGPDEPVPNDLRIMASGENLGELRSVHRPASFMARMALRRSRIYLYRNGIVLVNGRGNLGLFRFDQATTSRPRGSALSVRRGDGAQLLLITRHWTDAEALISAVEAGVAAEGGGR